MAEKTDMSTGTSYPDIFQFGTITHRFTYKRPNFQQLKRAASAASSRPRKGMCSFVVTSRPWS